MVPLNLTPSELDDFEKLTTSLVAKGVPREDAEEEAIVMVMKNRERKKREEEERGKS